MQDKTILVIDDDIHMCFLLEKAFERVGARVHSATDPGEGLRKLQAINPDLVILDIVIPDASGWEICRQIRELSAVPIVIVTVLHRDQEVIRGLEAGADAFMTKPFSPKVLVARAQAVLRRIEMLAIKNYLSLYEDDDLFIDPDELEIFAGKKPGQAPSL